MQFVGALLAFSILWKPAQTNAPVEDTKQLELLGEDIRVGVRLTWSPSEKRSRDFTHFVVRRQRSGEATWKVIQGKLSPTMSVYVDRTAEPTKEYRYRVTAYDAEHKAVPEVWSLETDPVKMGIWKLSFPTVQKGMAYIKIHKYDSALGEVVSINHLHRAGEKIGWWKNKPTDANPTSLRRLPTGKTAVVDLDTGLTLVSVLPMKVEVEVMKCGSPLDRIGTGKVFCPIRRIKVAVPTTEIIYSEKDGKKITVYKPALPTHPLARDQRCKEHRP